MDSPDSPDEDLPDVPRSAEGIARRAAILYGVIGCAHGSDKRTVSDGLKRWTLWSDVSPEEREFLQREHTEQQRINISWRAEAMAPLLWALGKIDPMPSLAEQFDAARAMAELVNSRAAMESFLSTATLRPHDEIQAEYEIVYEAHWRVRDARLFGKPPPAGVDAGIVQERHHAFNWIIGYGNQTWDEVSTDT